MLKSFECDMDRVGRDLSRMAGLVEDAVRNAVTAVLDRDREKAQAVIDGDGEIDALENEVDRQCTRVLAVHQPVARDLRRVLTFFHAAADLERMADLAGGIAERAQRLADLPPTVPPDRLASMADRASAMVRDGLNAFLHGDARLARAVRRRDDEVDADNTAIIGDLIAQMSANPAAVEPGLSLFTVVRNLERIADHATNIAEDAVFLIEGEVIRHRPESALPADVRPAPARTSR